jgi:ABC-type transport system involved in cytochrome bd biosynthesis fused ATPase/permease subunit
MNDENGTEIFVGEHQRISIVRAFFERCVYYIVL